MEVNQNLAINFCITRLGIKLYIRQSCNTRKNLDNNDLKTVFQFSFKFSFQLLIVKFLFYLL